MRLMTLVRIFMMFKGYKLKVLAAELDVTPRELRLMINDKPPSGPVLAKVLRWALNGETKAEETKGATHEAD